MDLRHLNVKQKIEGLDKDTGQALPGGERRKDNNLPQNSSHTVKKQYPSFTITKVYEMQFIIYCKHYEHLQNIHTIRRKSIFQNITTPKLLKISKEDLQSPLLTVSP
jgi:hypothetical protein